jgi:hypothetical protein
MFNKRSIQVKLVKDKKNVAPAMEQEPRPSFQDFVQTTRDGLKDVAIATIAGIAVYIVLDTARQVIVERSKSTN